MGAVVPDGGLDLATVDAVEASVEEAARRGEFPLVLDLSRLDFMDSTGVNLLVRLRERYGGQGLRIRGTRGRAGRVLELSRLGQLAEQPGDAG